MKCDECLTELESPVGGANWTGNLVNGARVEFLEVPAFCREVPFHRLYSNGKSSILPQRNTQASDESYGTTVVWWPRMLLGCRFIASRTTLKLLEFRLCRGSQRAGFFGFLVVLAPFCH